MTTATIVVADLRDDQVTLLVGLKNDNRVGAPRRVISLKEDWRDAIELSDLGLLAMEQMSHGARLHITRLGLRVLAALGHNQ